ncbi:hypothetical protein [Kribbella yunnanensis]|uniref:hypothetical protein n=1 Tax=Kribbella yunnanensis TaxID=190194 RepID=UPI0031D9A007
MISALRAPSTELRQPLRVASVDKDLAAACLVGDGRAVAVSRAGPNRMPYAVSFGNGVVDSQPYRPNA